MNSKNGLNIGIWSWVLSMKLEELTHLKTRYLISISLVFGVFFAFFIPFFLDWVVTLGGRIPKPETEVLVDYYTGTLWALALGGTIFLWPVPWTDKKMLLAGWFIKVCVTLGVLLIYEYKYFVDGMGYYYFSPILKDDIPFKGLFSIGIGTEIRNIGTWNMLRLVLLHSMVVPGSYHAMKVTYSMFGLVGVYIYYRAVLVWLNVFDKRYFYLLLLAPSLLFWNSLIGKESPFLITSAIYCYGVFSFYKSKKYRYLLLAMWGVAICMFARLWTGLIFIPPLIFFIFFGQKRLLTKIGLVLILVPSLLFTFGQIMERFNFHSAQDLIDYAEFRSEHFG